MFLGVVLVAAVAVLSLFQVAYSVINSDSEAAEWIGHIGDRLYGKILGRRGDVIGGDPSVAISRSDMWEMAHQRICERARKKTHIGLLFLGDSITSSLWKAQDVLDEYWGTYDPDYFGLPGDETQHLLWRIQNGEVEGLNPKCVVVLIGTNNVSFKTGSDRAIAGGVSTIVQTLRNKLPDSKILVMGILPRGRHASDSVRARIARINARVANLDNGSTIRYADSTIQLLEPDGSISPSVMPDYLHLSHKGYKIWLTSIKPFVDGMLR
jgi:lysophospholipase L1-like esterase